MDIKISLEKYEELIKKEFVYEILKNKAMNSNYISEEEKRLFNMCESE